MKKKKKMKVTNVYKHEISRYSCLMSIPMKLLKNRDESDEIRSKYYDHEAIRLRGQKSKYQR